MDVYGLGVTLYEALTGDGRPSTPSCAAGARPALAALPESDLAALVTAMLDDRSAAPPDARTTRCARLGEITAGYGSPAWPHWARLEGNRKPDLT